MQDLASPLKVGEHLRDGGSADGGDIVDQLEADIAMIKTVDAPVAGSQGSKDKLKEGSPTNNQEEICFWGLTRALSP